MKVLLISTGDGFLKEWPEAEDTFQRHLVYQARLRELAPDSEVRILSLTRGRGGGGWQMKRGLCCAWIGVAGLGGLAAVLRQLVTIPLFREWRPDVVSSQSPLEDGLVGLLLARRLGARCQTQIHFQRRQIDSDYGGGHRAMIARYVLGHADRLRFVSTPQRADFLTADGIDPARTSIAPVPMILQAMARENPGPPQAERAPVILFAGRFAEQKNLTAWLAVARLVAEAAPDARFVLAGDGPQRADFEARVAALGLTDRFEFPGSLGLEPLAAEFRRAAVFLLTSHDDAFGRVVVEAAAHRVPVVSTRCGGPEEIILEGRTGRLFDHGDVDGMAQACIGLLDDVAARDAMGEAARAHVTACYDIAPLADRIARSWLETAAHG